ncbi:hypothetical protein B0J12DRAFT_749699 [Macrophomina phaseolina]|uniref:Uncharacterized protein n=1 Tax=Macrophomina phaseolina TaxID=35725 RepID=A0ABQ8GYS8_9PEZI|nr:hypothetical protein B0J12DRAFT_749699 [Macrophomina phaseolina]
MMDPVIRPAPAEDHSDPELAACNRNFKPPLAPASRAFTGAELMALQQKMSDLGKTVQENRQRFFESRQLNEEKCSNNGDMAGQPPKALQMTSSDTSSIALPHPPRALPTTRMPAPPADQLQPLHTSPAGSAAKSPQYLRARPHHSPTTSTFPPITAYNAGYPPTHAEAASTTTYHPLTFTPSTLLDPGNPYAQLPPISGPDPTYTPAYNNRQRVAAQQPLPPTYSYTPTLSIPTPKSTTVFNSNKLSRCPQRHHYADADAAARLRASEEAGESLVLRDLRGHARGEVLEHPLTGDRDMLFGDGEYDWEKLVRKREELKRPVKGDRERGEERRTLLEAERARKLEETKREMAKLKAQLARLSAKVDDGAEMGGKGGAIAGAPTQPSMAEWRRKLEIHRAVLTEIKQRRAAAAELRRRTDFTKSTFGERLLRQMTMDALSSMPGRQTKHKQAPETLSPSTLIERRMAHGAGRTGLDVPGKAEPKSTEKGNPGALVAPSQDAQSKKGTMSLEELRRLPVEERLILLGKELEKNRMVLEQSGLKAKKDSPPS